MANDVRDAFERLKSSISREDAQDFHSTTLQDVRLAVRSIENQQAQCRSLRNMRRIEPFLKFMESYAKVIEAGCQGFPPMAWVWVWLTLLFSATSICAASLRSLIDHFIGTNQAHASGRYNRLSRRSLQYCADPLIKLASQYTNVLEKLLDAYKQIAEELPKVDRLRQTFGKDEGFQKALGLIYGDIIEFHGRAYKFFRRRGIEQSPSSSGLITRC